MFQSLLHTSEPLTVSAFTARVKSLLESDGELADVRINGEIGNLARPASGHLYFTLKDASAQVKCVMWRASVARLRQTPRTGDAVTVRGHIGVYERDGAYQLYVDSLVAAGAGDLYLEFERLKGMLEAEGLFDAARKRPLPEFPRVLGVVTSPTGAAFQDILNVLNRRYSMLELILAPTLVQGDEAPTQIVRAIQALDALGVCDVILVTRGGGSMEELWAFNDERVVRAVVASGVPVVSGVGHEIDFTLTDFAADVRAPTPSAAAEIISPDMADLRQNLDDLSARLEQLIAAVIEEGRARIDMLQRTLRMVSPLAQIVSARERVDHLMQRLNTVSGARLDLQREQLRGLAGRLEAMSPAATLARGYAIVRREREGNVVRSINDVQAGDGLSIRVADGAFTAITTASGVSE
jgi:exodeoxyribonuclease VII large subunit